MSAIVRVYPTHVSVVTVGIKGDPGESGADKTYVHTQAVPSAVWVVSHGLDKYPAITVIDSAGTVVHGGVAYDSGNQVTLTFSAAFSGQAFFN